MDQRLVDLVGKIPFWETLGIRLDEVEVGRVRVRMAMRDDMRTFGERAMMHGGAIATLIDAAAASAARTLQQEDEPPWRGLATTDLNVSYLSGVTSGDAVAEGRILRAGRQVAYASIEVRDDDGELVAAGRATMLIRRA